MVTKIFWFLLIEEGVLQALGMVILRDPPPTTHSGSSDDANSRIAWKEVSGRIDLLGSCLSVSGLILLVYALTTADTAGWDSPDVVTTLVLSVFLLIGFFYVEVKTARFPLLPHYLWKDIAKVSGCLVAALTYAVWMGVNYLLTIELQGETSSNHYTVYSHGYGVGRLTSSLDRIWIFSPWHRIAIRSPWNCCTTCQHYCSSSSETRRS